MCFGEKSCWARVVIPPHRMHTAALFESLFARISVINSLKKRCLSNLHIFPHFALILHTHTRSMPLIYAFVAVTKGPTKTILVEYTAYSGNFSTIATQVLLLLLLRDLSPATDTCGERRTDKMYSFSFHSNVTGFR